MRTSLKASLFLLLDLPLLFIQHVASRLGCGMASVLCSCFHHFENADDWYLVSDLLNMAAGQSAGRSFVFEGIASCLEHVLPNTLHSSSSDDVAVSRVLQSANTSEGKEEESSVFSNKGASTLAKILIKFSLGSYDNDMSMSVPAMHLLERVYWYLHKAPLDKLTAQNGLDEQLWQTVATSFFHVSLSPDINSALKGVDCLQRLLLTTDVSDSLWLTMLKIITSKQPLVNKGPARVKMIQFLCNLLLILTPRLSQEKANWDSLTDIINQTSLIVGENLLEGRQGSVSPLFESTVESVTNMSNVMLLMPEFDKSGFSLWAGEIFFSELEKVGACGGSAKMRAATTSTKENFLENTGL